MAEIKHEGRPFSYTWSEKNFEDALATSCCHLAIEYFNDDQRKALTSFFKDGKDIYYCAPTGHGKSIVYQAIPVIADELAGLANGTTQILVVTPLKSLMEDQVKSLKDKTAVTAAAVFQGQDDTVLREIEDGQYSIVYATPESLLSNSRWRKILSSHSFGDFCVGVVIDEAHCIKQWGTSSSHKEPFRVWFSFLREIKSLLPKDTQYAAFTATATRSTKHTIFEVLGMNTFDTFVLEKSPMRPNLKFSIEYIGNDKPFEEVFQSIIIEVRREGLQTVKTLIFCQTRAQAATIWRTFELNLGKNMYASPLQEPRNRLVEMFHAGTPENVKKHILSNIVHELGSIRVLVCTIAFGMGINCSGVHRIVHFGPSKSVESYLQECGRAGRDNATSYCHLLYNGFLQIHCDNDMKHYILSQDCRRKQILSSFPGKHDQIANISPCDCCDICAQKCPVECIANECKKDNFFIANKGDSEVFIERRREVSEENKKLVAESLNHLLEEAACASSITPKNLSTAFSHFHVDQVMKSVEFIFSRETLKHYVEIWRKEHALRILMILNEVFDDIDPDEMEVAGFHNSGLSVQDEACYDSENEWQLLLDDSEFDALVEPSHVVSEVTTQSDSLQQSDQNIDYSLTGLFNISGCALLQSGDNNSMEIEN